MFGVKKTLFFFACFLAPFRRSIENAHHAGSCLSSGHFGQRNRTVPCRMLPLKWSLWTTLVRSFVGSFVVCAFCSAAVYVFGECFITFACFAGSSVRWLVRSFVARSGHPVVPAPSNQHVLRCSLAKFGVQCLGAVTTSRERAKIGFRVWSSNRWSGARRETLQ